MSFFFSVFSPFWREFFGGLGEKTPGPHHLFSFLPPNQTHSKNVFLLVFSPKFSIPPISLPNKHILKLTELHGWNSQSKAIFIHCHKTPPPSQIHGSESPSLFTLYSHHPSLSLLELSLWGLNPWPPLLAMVNDSEATTGGHRSFFSPSLFFTLFFCLIQKLTFFFLIVCAFRFAWVWGLRIFGLRV